MSSIRFTGLGAVSPAGWSLPAMRDALGKGELLSTTGLTRPGLVEEIPVLRVPAPSPRPPFLAHARLRRSSPISQFALAAALEALGPDPGDLSNLGVIVCVFSGCVNYSRRFYDETLKDPLTASPLVFPETVFNAPASHISAYLGSTAINYTLVGDSGTFLIGLSTAANWLLEGKVDRALVVGTEEIDWLTTDAVRLFKRKTVLSEGAGAVLLASGPASGVELVTVTDEHLFSGSSQAEALDRVRAQLSAAPSSALLCDSAAFSPSHEFSQSGPRLRLSPRHVLGEGLMSAAAWQCVAAVDALGHGAATDAIVEIAGFHQHAIGAHFRRC